MATRHAVLIGIVLAGAALAGCERKAEPGAAPAAGSAAPASGATTAGEGAPAAATTSAAAPGATAAAASTGADTSAPAADRADSIRASAAQWPKVEGRWTRGDTDSRYVAYFDGGELRYLEENMSMGDYGSRQNRYFYEDGALFYYVGEKSSDVPGSTGPGGLPPVVPVVAEFRGPEVVRGVAREHFGEKKLDAAIVEGIRRHGAVLAGAAQDEWSAQQR
jgi:hypothetical protein